MKKIIILKEFLNYSPLDIIEDGEKIIKEGNLSKDSYLLLEKLSNDDIKQIKDLIKAQLRVVFWNLYTKQNYIVQ